MARDVKVNLKLKGLNELMTSAPVQAEVARTANRIANSAGPGHSVDWPKKRHPWVARAYVRQSWMKARTDSTAMDLLRGVGSAGK